MSRQAYCCSHIDPQATSFIADTLLQCAAVALVHQGILDPLVQQSKARDAVTAFSAALANVADIAGRSGVTGATPESRFGRQLEGAMRETAEASKSGFARFDVLGVFAAAEEKRAAQTASVAAALNQHVLTPSVRRLAALELIHRHDTTQAATCGAVFPSAAELDEHCANACACRPIPCEFAGCSTVTAARHAASHAAQCPRRLVACDHHGGCGAAVAFEMLAAHVTVSCPKRDVVCPFQCIGCVAPLQADALASHCADVNMHLVLAARCVNIRVLQAGFTVVVSPITHAHMRCVFSLFFSLLGSMIAAQGEILNQRAAEVHTLRVELQQSQADGKVLRTAFLALQSGVEQREATRVKEHTALAKTLKTLEKRVASNEVASARAAKVVVANEKSVKAITAALGRR